ncbi:LuxR C-terminal-related transcriptional regulator, partial [Bradyrhizobium sp. Mp27]
RRLFFVIFAPDSQQESSPLSGRKSTQATVRICGASSGIELLKRMKAQHSPFPILIMTGHGDVPLAVEAMKLGAVDFVEKPFEDDPLTAMIESALRQAAPAAKNEAIAQDIAARVASLSPRERQVMQGLVAGLSNKLIARDYDISPRTIEVYRANVMTKMQANSLSELVRLAMRAGLLND